ncbi:hypothetical protein K4F52_010340, partial [Lecanicillium sp. MT-2017a]
MDGVGYSSAYDDVEDDVLYVKMDTDIVYIEDSVILSLAYSRASRPDAYLIGANVVNQPLSSWLHWSLGAVRPYLPEANGDVATPAADGLDDWRPSQLPAWKGSTDSFDVEAWQPPTGRKHRWLPVHNKSSHVLDQTPILTTEYDAYGGLGWQKWTI